MRAAMTCIRFFTHGASSYLQLGEQQVYFFFFSTVMQLVKLFKNVPAHMRNLTLPLTLNLTLTLYSAGWSEPKNTWGHTCRSSKDGVVGGESLRSTQSRRWCRPMTCPGYFIYPYLASWLEFMSVLQSWGLYFCGPLLALLLHSCLLPVK